MCHGQMIDSAIRKARKRWRCELCYQPIAPGSEYHDYVQGGPDGLVHTRTHKTCQALLQATDAFDYDNCFSGDDYQMLQEYAKEVGCKRLLSKARSWFDSKKRKPEPPEVKP